MIVPLSHSIKKKNNDDQYPMTQNPNSTISSKTHLRHLISCNCSVTHATPEFTSKKERKKLKKQNAEFASTCSSENTSIHVF